MEKIISLSDLADLRKELKKKRKNIVFTSGAYDIIHVGHARYLSSAAEKGDVLVVGVTGNEAIKKLKGPGKPILDEKIRSEMLLYLSSVDYVVIIPEITIRSALIILKPDIFVTVGEDWNDGYLESPEAKTVIEYGGKVELVPRQSMTISTSKIIEKIITTSFQAQFKSYFKQKIKPLK